MQRREKVYEMKLAHGRWHREITDEMGMRQWRAQALIKMVL